MPYQDIVFMQGDDAAEPLRLLDEKGTGAAVEYLSQWDNGDGGEVSDTSQSGRDDWQETVGEYVLSWNNRLGYIGLERIV